jgi:large subunit ribosomal protein L29
MGVSVMPKRRKLRSNEIRDMNDEEIDAKIKELGVELFRETAIKEFGGMAYTADGNPNRYAMIKRDIARLKTIKRERELK